MARLPQPGGDAGNWGQILNDFLGQAHQPDGSLKAGIVQSNNIAANAVTINGLGATGGTDGQVLTKDSASATGLKWSTVSGGGTTTAVAMGGDLTGQSNNAQLAAGVVGSAELANQAVTGAKIANGTITETQLDPTVVSKLNAAGSGSVADGSITAPKLNTGAGTNGQVLVLDSTAPGGFKWQTITTGSATPTGPAGGALSGTYPNPTLANGAVSLANISISGTPTNGQILSYNGSGLAWINAPAGGGAVTSVAGKTGAVTLVEGDIANLTTDLAAKATDAAVVHLAGSETVSGVKTFSASPIVPTPTTNTQAANKAYVDSAIAAIPTGGGAGLTFKPVTVTSATYTAAVGDYVFADAASTGITITLPAPQLNATVRVQAMDNSSNSIQVIAPSGSYINGPTAGSITANIQYQGGEFWSDGNNWFTML